MPMYCKNMLFFKKNIYLFFLKKNLSRRQNLIKCKEYNEYKGNQKTF